MNNDKLYVFAHIPKTGGTSLRTHFQKHLIGQNEFVHLSEKGNNDALKKNENKFSKKSVLEKQKIKVILGHDVTLLTGKEIRNKNINRIVVFRDPRSWLISRYNQAVHDRKHNGQNIMGFCDWVKAFPNIHSQFNWFASNYLGMGKHYFNLGEQERNKIILNSLKEFNMVINLNMLDNRIKKITKELNIPSLDVRKNVSKYKNKQHFKKTINNNRLLDDTIRLDLELFEKIAFK